MADNPFAKYASAPAPSSSATGSNPFAKYAGAAQQSNTPSTVPEATPAEEPAAGQEDTGGDATDTEQPGLGMPQIPGMQQFPNQLKAMPPMSPFLKDMKHGFDLGYKAQAQDTRLLPQNINDWVGNGLRDAGSMIGGGIAAAGAGLLHAGQWAIPGTAGRKPAGMGGEVTPQERQEDAQKSRTDPFHITHPNPISGTVALFGEPEQKLAQEMAGNLAGTLHYKYTEPASMVMQGWGAALGGDLNKAQVLSDRASKQFGESIARHPGEALTDALAGVVPAAGLAGRGGMKIGSATKRFATAKNIPLVSNWAKGNAKSLAMIDELKGLSDKIRIATSNLQGQLQHLFDQIKHDPAFGQDIRKGDRLIRVLEFRDGGFAYANALKTPILGPALANFKLAVDAVNNRVSKLLIADGVITQGDKWRAQFGSWYQNNAGYGPPSAANIKHPLPFEEICPGGSHEKQFLAWASHIDKVSPDIMKPTFFTLRAGKAVKNYLESVYHGLWPGLRLEDMMQGGTKVLPRPYQATARRSNVREPFHEQNPVLAATAQTATMMSYLHLKDLFKKWAAHPDFQPSSYPNGIPKGMGVINLDEIWGRVLAMAKGSSVPVPSASLGSVVLPAKVVKYLEKSFSKGSSTGLLFDLLVSWPTRLSTSVKLGLNPLFVPVQRIQDTAVVLATIKSPKDALLTAFAAIMAFTPEGKKLIPYFLQYDHSQMMMPQFQGLVGKLVSLNPMDLNFKIENIGQNYSRRWFALRELNRAFAEATPAAQSGVIKLLTSANEYWDHLKDFANKNTGVYFDRVRPKTNKFMGNYGPLEGFEKTLAAWFPFYRWTAPWKHSGTLAWGMITEYPLTVTGAILASSALQKAITPEDMPERNRLAGDVRVKNYDGSDKTVTSSGKSYPVNINASLMTPFPAAAITVKDLLTMMHVLPQVDEGRSAPPITPFIGVGYEHASGKKWGGGDIRSYQGQVSSQGRIYDTKNAEAAMYGDEKLMNKDGGQAVDTLASIARNLGGNVWQHINEWFVPGGTIPGPNSTPWKPDHRTDSTNRGAPVPKVGSQLPGWALGVDSWYQRAQVGDPEQQERFDKRSARKAVRSARRQESGEDLQPSPFDSTVNSGKSRRK